MNTEHFPSFVRVIFPTKAHKDISNDTLVAMGKEFKKYLEEKFRDNMENLEKIWNIDPPNAIRNFNHPFRTKGYHPALVIHFTNFIEQEKDKLTTEKS